MNREELGRKVREVWVAWARERRDNGIETKSSWLQSWEQLTEPEREVDRRIGEVLYAEGQRDPQVPGRQTLRGQVAEFHMRFEQAIRYAPEVPDDDTVRFRARLITEEYFETVSALFGYNAVLDGLKSVVMKLVDTSPIAVNMPEFVDGMADLDYVVEGTRLTFGVDGEPIAAAVHAANLSKLGDDGRPIRREDGKILKNAKWSPPDIAGVLRKLGWKD